MRLSRRTALRALGATLLTPCLPGLMLGAQGASTGNRFVLVILRGALDGLAAVQPHGDPDLARWRESLLVPPSRLLPLDDFFGLHPALPELHACHASGELEVFHAIATPYRERSHFDGQNVLETGLARVDGRASGWLNRCAARMAGVEPVAMAVGQTMPRVLQGEAPVGAWSADTLPGLSPTTLERLERLYAEDAFLGERLTQGLRTQGMVDDANGMGAGSDGDLRLLADVAARFLVADAGPAIAVIESNGWDTHAGQGGADGTLARRLAGLDLALAVLRRGLGERWRDTQVLVVTEFGRTVAVNGSGGTDHGTASVALRLGGTTKGGAVRADWPGLGADDLLDGRDLRPTLDLRMLYREAAVHLLGSAEGLDL